MGRHYGRKVDEAQPPMVAALRAMGFAVLITSRAGGDAPDIIVGKLGITVLVEVKTPTRAKEHKARLERQASAREAWLGDAFIQATTTEAVVECFQQIHAARRAA